MIELLEAIELTRVLVQTRMQNFYGNPRQGEKYA